MSATSKGAEREHCCFGPPFTGMTAQRIDRQLEKQDQDSHLGKVAPVRARRLLKEANVLIRRKARRITPEGKNEVERHITRLDRALSLKTRPRIKEQKAALRIAISRLIPRTK